MAYMVLARRYRSKTFDEVVGQEAIAKTLANAIRTDRVAHAYLFCGTRGVGKTTMARILARALNCEKGPTSEPCGRCDICEAIHRGDDVDVLEIDGASNNLVEDVRTLRDNAHYLPSRARFKIYYIDEVHMLSRSAFNALLKTLEEPPQHVKFIFSTTEPERLPATILSRCQRFDFRAVPTDAIAAHLGAICKKEKVKADKDALTAMAREGRGSVRDALTLLDQVIAVSDGRVTLETVRGAIGAVSGESVGGLIAACGDGDPGEALRRLADLLAGGADVTALLDQLMRQVRDLLVVKTCGTEVELLDVFGPDREMMLSTAEKFSVPALVASLGYLAEARNRVGRVVDGRPVAELALVRMASLGEMQPLPEVLGRLEALCRSLGEAGPPGPRAAAPAAAPPASAPPVAAPAKAQAPAEKKKAVGLPQEAESAEEEDEAALRGDAPAEEAAGPPRKRRKIEQAMNDPLVQKALDLFEGRIVNIED